MTIVVRRGGCCVAIMLPPAIHVPRVSGKNVDVPEPTAVPPPLTTVVCGYGRSQTQRMRRTNTNTDTDPAPTAPTTVSAWSAAYDVWSSPSQDHPLDLSILLSGGKETNKDSPSNGE